MDKYKSCHECPDRAVGCRASCEGWQKREEEKKERYAQKRMEIAAAYSSQSKMRYIRDVTKQQKLGRKV